MSIMTNRNIAAAMIGRSTAVAIDRSLSCIAGITVGRIAGTVAASTDSDRTTAVAYWPSCYCHPSCSQPY